MPSKDSGWYASLVVLINISELLGQRLRICKCRHGYEGKLCEIDIDWCDVIRNSDSVPCDYGMCQWPVQLYTEHDCIKDEGECDYSMPCENSGICIRKLNATYFGIDQIYPKYERYGLLKGLSLLC
jgi:hypothetical protein